MKIDKLKYWSLIAEIVGGVAIVVTLVILVYELQRNTSAIQRATYSEITESVDEWRATLTLNPEVRATLASLDNGEVLTPDQESIRLGRGRTLYSIYERAFWANEYGHVGESEWARFERMICRAVPRFWDEEGAFVFTDEFVAYIHACP